MKPMIRSLCLALAVVLSSVGTADAGLIRGLFNGLLGGRHSSVRFERPPRTREYRNRYYYAGSYRPGSFGRYRNAYEYGPDGRLRLMPYMDSNYQWGIHR